MAAPQVPGGPVGMQNNLARSAGIQSVEQVGEGQYRAKFGDGRAITLTGPAGEKAYKQFSGGAPPAPPPGQQPGAPTAPTPGPSPTPAPVRAPPANSVLPYAAEGVDPVTQKKVTGQAEMVNGQMVIRLPGSKGSPGGITKLGQEILDERAAANAAAQPHEQTAAAAQAEGVRLGIEQNEKEKAFLEQRKQGMMNEVANQQQEADDQANFVTELRAREEKAREEYEASRPPEETQQQSALATIGGALGAFGASLGKTPNFASDLIQQLRNNKMRKWEAEVAIRGDRANNLLAKYHAATGDMKLAKAAVKATLDEQFAVEAQQMALSTKSEAMANNWKQVSAAAQANAIRSGQESAEAKKLAFMANRDLNRPAVAGSAPRTILATQGAYGERQDQNKSAEELRLKQEADRRAAAGEGPGGAKDAPDAVKKSIGEIDAAIAGLNRMKEQDRELGKPMNLLTSGGSFASDEANAIASAGSAVGPGVARAIEGDAATKDSMDRAVGGLTSGTPGQREFAREQYLQQLEAKKRAILESQ